MPSSLFLPWVPRGLPHSAQPRILRELFLIDRPELTFHGWTLCGHCPGDQNLPRHKPGAQPPLWTMSVLRAGTSLGHVLLLDSWRGPGLEHGLPGYWETVMILQPPLRSPDARLPVLRVPCGSVHHDCRPFGRLVVVLTGQECGAHSTPGAEHTPSKRPGLCKGPPHAVPCHERKNSYRSGASQRWGPTRVGLQQNWGSSKTQQRCCDMLGQRQSPGT